MDFLVASILPKSEKKNTKKIKPNVQANLFQKLATSAEHVVCQNCSECQNKTKTTICRHIMG